jgi:hypothetical protein
MLLPGRPRLSSVQISKDKAWNQGRTLAFSLAIGSVRQVCHLKTDFQTQAQALSYLHKNRTAIERIARERFGRGEIEDGVIHLTML